MQSSKNWVILGFTTNGLVSVEAECYGSLNIVECQHLYYVACRTANDQVSLLYVVWTMVDISIIVVTVMHKALSLTCVIDTRDNVSQKCIIIDI